MLVLVCIFGEKKRILGNVVVSRPCCRRHHHQLFKHQNETLGVLASPTHYFLFLGFLRPLRFIAVSSGSWVVPIRHIYVHLSIGQAKSDSRSALIVQRSASSGLNLHPQIKHWVALLKSPQSASFILMSSLVVFILFQMSSLTSIILFVKNIYTIMTSVKVWFRFRWTSNAIHNVNHKPKCVCFWYASVFFDLVLTVPYFSVKNSKSAYITNGAISFC